MTYRANKKYYRSIDLIDYRLGIIFAFLSLHVFILCVCVYKDTCFGIMNNNEISELEVWELWNDLVLGQHSAPQ